MRSWIDLALMLLTFTLTIGWSVEVGVAVSIVISLLLVIHRSSKARLMILVSSPIHTVCQIPGLSLRRFAWFREGSLEPIGGGRLVRILKRWRILRLGR